MKQCLLYSLFRKWNTNTVLGIQVSTIPSYLPKASALLVSGFKKVARTLISWVCSLTPQKKPHYYLESPSVWILAGRLLHRTLQVFLPGLNNRPWECFWESKKYPAEWPYPLLWVGLCLPVQFIRWNCKLQYLGMGPHMKTGFYFKFYQSLIDLHCCVSCVQWSESVIHIHIPTFFRLFLHITG